MVQSTQLPFEETNNFSKLFLNYLAQDESLDSFYETFPQIEKLQEYFGSFENINRPLLVTRLRAQHKGLTLSEKQAKNIEDLLDNNTYTVTTGHQLNIFCGPLYFIYKIVTTVKACEALKIQYPDKNFVPVYWMASEDHDFDEISHFSLFGKQHTWQTQQKGAVGRMNTEEMSALLDELPDLPALFEAYRKADHLASATRQIVHDLFKIYGVVILDADDKALKEALVPYIEKDVLQRTNEALIQEDTQKLEALGYKGQLHPRAINFFYLDHATRSRIVFENNRYKVLNTALEWSEEDMQLLIKEAPEKFSPNVALRPLYQQVLLPNIAYIGGPGELVYWLQLHSFFRANEVTFPALMPRNFGLYLNKGLTKKLKKLKLSPADLFRSPQELKQDYLASQDVAFTLAEETAAMRAVYDSISSKATEIDKSLAGALGAETQKAHKQIQQLEKRIKKAQEKQHEQGTNQILHLQQKLFPNGGLQERHDNFLNFYINDEQFIEKLMGTFEPFNYQFNVLLDE